MDGNRRIETISSSLIQKRNSQCIEQVLLYFFALLPTREVCANLRVRKRREINGVQRDRIYASFSFSKCQFGQSALIIARGIPSWSGFIPDSDTENESNLQVLGKTSTFHLPCTKNTVVPFLACMDCVNLYSA